MSYQTIIDHYRTSLQTAYRQAVDADTLLEQIQEQGHGKHQAVFRPDAGFRSQSNRFLPYVQELAEDLAKFEQAPEQAELARLVKQLETLLTTLAQLRQSLKS